MICKNCLKRMTRLGVFETLLGHDAGKKISSLSTNIGCNISDTQRTEATKDNGDKCKRNIGNVAECTVETLPATPIREKTIIYETLSSAGAQADVDNCKPSKLKDFQREKLENICKRKVRTQLRNQQAGDAFLVVEFPKDERTGEYITDGSVVEKLKSEADQYMKENRGVRAMIEKLEAQKKEDFERKNLITYDCRSFDFKEIVNKFSQLDKN